MSDIDRDPDWTLTIPAPAKWISSNDRIHWREKAARTKGWRDAAQVHARQAKLPTGLERVRIDAWLRFKTLRIRDAGNYADTLKAIVDGLVKGRKAPHGYGLVADDDAGHLEGPYLHLGELLTYRGSGPSGLVEVGIFNLTPGVT